MPRFFVSKFDAQYVPIQQVTIVRNVQSLSEHLTIWRTMPKLVVVKKSEHG